MATPPAEAGGKAEMPAEARQEKSFSPRSSGLPGSLGSGRVGNMDSHYRRPNGLQPFLHKTAWRFALFLLLALAIRAFSTEAGIVDKEPPFNPQDFVRDKIVLILGSFKDFHEAHTRALFISNTAKMPFSMSGMIYDKKRGLILPDNDPDETYAGSYVLRRYNELFNEPDKGAEYISIERSEAYPGFTPGFYIIMGGIYNDPKEAKGALTRFKPFVKDAYIKKTKIYMGCMH